jgi:hypothetical protein
VPANTALLAVLMLERPLCVSCLSAKSGLTVAAVESYVARIHNTVDVHRGIDHCRVCGNTVSVYSLMRRD